MQTKFTLKQFIEIFVIVIFFAGVVYAGWQFVYDVVDNWWAGHPGFMSNNVQQEETYAITPYTVETSTDVMYQMIMDCAKQNHPEVSLQSASDFYQCAFGEGKVIVLTVVDMNEGDSENNESKNNENTR